MTFDAAAPEFATSSIDLLHIDGRHFYDDVKHDFETWAPKLMRPGIVLFHDTRVLDRGFGVHRLWSEIRGAYPSFEFPHGHGLGVLAVGESLPPSLVAFFELAKDATAAGHIRAAYERLGASLEEPAKRGRQAFKTGWRTQARRGMHQLLGRA